MEETKESSLNWKKTIENFRNNYTIKNKIDVLFIELIANAVDAEIKESWCISIRSVITEACSLNNDGYKRGVDNRKKVY